jgi:hypothetical protein
MPSTGRPDPILLIFMSVTYRREVKLLRLVDMQAEAPVYIQILSALVPKEKVLSLAGVVKLNSSASSSFIVACWRIIQHH